MVLSPLFLSPLPFPFTFTFTSSNAPPANTPTIPFFTCLPSGVSAPKSVLHFKTLKKSSKSLLLTIPHLHSKTYVTGLANTDGVTVHTLSTSALCLLSPTLLIRCKVMRRGSILPPRLLLVFLPLPPV